MIRVIRKRRATEFDRDRRGSAAIEFAVVVPVLLIVLFGTFEISKYLQTNNQVVQTVSMTGQMVSQLAAASTVEDVQRIWGSAPLIAPEASRIAKGMGGEKWSNVMSLTFTSVAFTKKDPACTANCQYDANVAWSVGSSPASCGKLQKAAEGAVAGPDSVPSLLYDEGSAISVFATLIYEPRLPALKEFLPGVAGSVQTTMVESGWFQPRNARNIVLTSNGGSTSPFRLCPEVNK